MESLFEHRVENLFDIGGRFNNFLEVATAVKNGLSPEYLLILKNLFKLNNDEIAELLGVSSRTISRSTKLDKLDFLVSDRIYRIFSILKKAIEVFNNQEEAIHWLKTSQHGLNNEIPLKLLSTEVGTKEVENLLGQIEYGIY